MHKIIADRYDNLSIQLTNLFPMVQPSLIVHILKGKWNQNSSPYRHKHKCKYNFKSFLKTEKNYTEYFAKQL